MKVLRNEKGQSMVETALLLPVLLMILVGVFDFGRIFYIYTHLHLATQETVRLGGLGATDTEMTTFVKDYVHINDPENLSVHIAPIDSFRNSGDYVTVLLEYPMDYMTPFVSNLLPSPFLVKTESTIRVE